MRDVRQEDLRRCIAVAAQELIRDVLAAARERSVLLITHRPEGLDLVDEIVTMTRGGIASAPTPVPTSVA